MKHSFPRKRSLHSFTLVELLVVLGIIALLATLLQPAFKLAIFKAQSVRCASNLRTIGVAVTMATADNNNQFPEIDQAAATIYPPAGSVQGLVGVLGPYGVLTNTVQCPVDIAGPNAFSLYGSSYEWDPVFDDENPLSPVVYGGNNAGRTNSKGFALTPARVRLCYDFNGVHQHGSRNVLYGDGHVSSH